MRLFLSSQDFGNYPDRLLQLIGDNKKAAFINNAKDDLPRLEREQKSQEKIAELETQGLESEELDLRDYFRKPDKLLDKLSNLGLVFIYGGNTFILRRAMAASGFDETIKKLLRDDQIVYGGSSAGSCVAARSLRGIDQGDRPQPDVVPSNYPIKKTIWEGLNLVPFMIVPHRDSDWFAKEADATIKYLRQHGLPYKALKDGQVIVIDGDKEEFLK